MTNGIAGYWSGSELTSQRVVVSGSGAADVLFTELHLQGPPGELALGGKVATRTMSGWAPAHASGVVDGPMLNSGRYVADVAAGSAGDALYVEGFKPNALPPMSFSARLRPAGAAGYGGASALHVGTQGEVRAAPLTAGRYLVLMRSGAGLRSRAGSPATGFGDHLVFSGTDATRLLELAGAPSGLAAAAWVTTAGQVHAAVYDDSLGPGSLPPTARPDDVAPMLSRLAVAPRRFTTRRRAWIRWRLSEPARVRLRIDRLRVGFRRGGRCVARRPQTGRVRRCARFRQVGTLTRMGPAGPTAVSFDRFVRRRALRPGRYRVTALPRDAAGNRGRAKRARFTILRRREAQGPSFNRRRAAAAGAT